MKTENITENDILSIKKLQPEGWSDITSAFKFYLNNLEWCTPVKIVMENSIVGIGSGISYGKTGWIAHIIVSTEYQKQGIGTFIVKSLCNILKKKNIETVSLIATEAGYPIYKKAGFIIETDYLFFERELFLLSDISEKIVEFSEQYKDRIYYLDKIISGEDRKNIIEQYLKTAYLYVENDTLFGYYMPDLGEGVIVAENDKAGIALMKLRCLKSNKAVLPSDNIRGVEFLKNNGFKETGRVKRMRFGLSYNWSYQGIYNRIAGNFG